MWWAERNLTCEPNLGQNISIWTLQKWFSAFHSILKSVPWHMFCCFVILPVCPLPIAFSLEPNPYRVVSSDASDEVLLLFAVNTDKMWLLLLAGFLCFFPPQAFIGDNKITVRNSVYIERAPIWIATCNRGWKNKTCKLNFDKVSKQARKQVDKKASR